MRTASLTFEVTEADTAAALGSGDLAVLGTPRLLAWAERTTCRVAGEVVGPGRTSVGTRVQLEHLLASAVGAAVEVRADLVHEDGRLLEFDVTATDGAGRLLATGRVRRVVVDTERFLARTVATGSPLVAGHPVPGHLPLVVTQTTGVGSELDREQRQGDEQDCEDQK